MKKIVFLLFSGCMMLGLNASAQRQNTYFLKNNGDYVSKADSADFIRIVQEPEKGSDLYPTKEYYPGGAIKSYGFSTRIDPPKYEGQFIAFFESGSKKQFTNYVAGRIVDSVYNFYPNGKLYTSLFYTYIGDSSVVNVSLVKDSTGTPLVTNGNGSAVFYDEDFKYVTGKGNIKNGKYDGEWTGELRSKDTLRYKEVYAEGRMLSGESTDGKGKMYHYSTSELKPQFKGGMTAFYRQIAKGVRYPPEAVRYRIQGIAQVRFVIKSNGEISDVRVINDVHPALAAEAVRMVKTSKGWSPGAIKGRVVDVSFTVPVSFTLG